VAATDAKELRAALAKLSQRHLVLIDTAGLGQRDEKLYGQYQMLQSTGLDISTYLLLNATSQYEALKETLQVFGADELTGAIVTKLDEAVSLGGLLDSLIESALPIAYVSDGQQVPDDLAPADGRALVSRAVELGTDPAPSLASAAGRGLDVRVGNRL